MIKREIQKNEAGQRFDKYLKKLLPGAPSSFLYKMLRKKNITLNGKKAEGSEKLNLEDEIQLFFSEGTFEKFSAKGLSEIKTEYPQTKLNILYEDEDILVINKPAGMLSQKAKDTDKSANEYIIRYLLDTGAVSIDELKTFKPSICNRLDRNTSGILVAGKTLKGLQEMSEWLRNRSLEKYYLCLALGKVRNSLHLKGWLEKDPQSNRVQVYKTEKPGCSYIKTQFQPLENYSYDFKIEKCKKRYNPGGIESGERVDFVVEKLVVSTLLEVRLLTGRTHQIRAHLASIDHPIIGDIKYGDSKANHQFAKAYGVKRQLLHAYRLRLPNGVDVTADLPEDFAAVIGGNEMAKQSMP